MERYPGEYENDLTSWLEESDLEDNDENREAFDTEMQNRSEEAEQRWLECAENHQPSKPLNPWDAYMEEMR